MKKLFICLIISTLLLCGCNNSDNTLKINLESNPTTGYTWTYQIADTSIVTCLSDQYVADNQDSEMDGVGGTEQYIFEGQKEGTTTITFKYARSWEQDDAQIKTYTIKVDSNRKVTIINQE